MNDHETRLEAIFPETGSGTSGLTQRVLYILYREGITSLGELLQCSDADLLELRNFGPKCLDLVVSVLAGNGYALLPGDDPMQQEKREDIGEQLR